jgi:hypothetical protein
MRRVGSVLLLVACMGTLISCGGQATSVPGVDVTGKWNATFTETGNNTPSYTVGLAFTKDTTVISGTEVTFTGGTQYNTGCVNYGGWTATGNTNGASVVTLSIHDPSTNSSFTVSAQANASVSQINGTFEATFGANGSNAACPATSGSVLFTRQ